MDTVRDGRPTGDALARLAEVPDVHEGVRRAREACAQLQRHPALRRLEEEARLEAAVRAACGSAALEGARLPLSLVRDAARGAADLPSDPIGAVVAGALRAVLQARALEPMVGVSPARVMASLHLAASAGVAPARDLGRPRPDRPPEVRAARLAALADLLRVPIDVPALLVAALAHAEVATLRPFGSGDGVVARALARSVIAARGLDPTGVAVVETGHVTAGLGYPVALAGYASGSLAGVTAWLVHVADAVVAGAEEGVRVCESVQAGRLP